LTNRVKAILKTSFLLIATLLFCYIVLSFFDSGQGNGLIADWFYKYFIIEYYSPYQGAPNAVLQSSLNWGSLKSFLIIVFVILAVFLVCLILLISYLHGRKRAREAIATISDAMKAYMVEENESPTLPKEYMAVENQLIQMKATQQRHEQIIREETQQKNDLITYLAHDLKTPLASVIGYLCLLDEAPDLPVEQKAKYIGIALEKAYRLEELINEFFEITRFNLHAVVVNPGKIRLAFMLQQMADEFYPILAPQQKRISLSVPKDLVLWGDADKLARVFNNILKNAAAYSYEGTAIDIAATQNDRTTVISFTNLGDPIPPQKLDTIFEKFFRLDSARSTNTGGAGLGLAIAKEIVTAHGGSIEAKSDKDHTAFTVKLPTLGIQK